MNDFIKTVLARHKWNAAFFLWSATWMVLDIINGSYIFAAIQAVFAVFFVWMGVWSEKHHRRHVARMEAIQNARTADDLLAVLRSR